MFSVVLAVDPLVPKQPSSVVKPAAYGLIADSLIAQKLIRPLSHVHRQSVIHIPQRTDHMTEPSQLECTGQMDAFVDSPFILYLACPAG
jgi:hypothetical protein